jgi:hypothetical protein
MPPKLPGTGKQQTWMHPVLLLQRFASFQDFDGFMPTLFVVKRCAAMGRLGKVSLSLQFSYPQSISMLGPARSPMKSYQLGISFKANK